MSNPNSPTLEEVMANIATEILRERVEQPENLETAIKVVVKERGQKLLLRQGSRSILETFGQEGIRGGKRLQVVGVAI